MAFRLKNSLQTNADVQDHALDHSNGHFFKTMEWSMVFQKKPLQRMVFLKDFYNSTIVVNYFVKFKPLVSMVFQWFFTI